MLSVQTLARRIRTRLHDTDEITYSDEEILDCINCGIRFIRRLIASMRPSLLWRRAKIKSNSNFIWWARRRFIFIRRAAADRIRHDARKHRRANPTNFDSAARRFGQERLLAMKLGFKHENQFQIVHADFSGGLNTSTSVDGILENQLARATNLEVFSSTRTKKFSPMTSTRTKSAANSEF